MSAPTLKDIAEFCEVSTATVSMVLSGKGSISPEMVNKINRTAAALRYVPRTAKVEKGKALKNIYIIQWEDKPFLWHFSQPFVLKLEKILVRQGFRPIIIHKIPELNDGSLLNDIKTSKAEAVFSIHYANPDLFDKLESENIPVIIINNSNYQDRFWSVLADDIQGAYEGTNILIQSGHCRIAFAEYKRDYQEVMTDRYYGFQRAIENAGISQSSSFKISADVDDLEDLKFQIKKVLETPQPPTAFFIHDDYFAAIVLGILTKEGYRVPEDISIICPGDVIDYSEPFFFRFSTMQVDRSLMIEMAWDLLKNRLNSDSTKNKVIKTKMHYVDRGSCVSPRS